MSSSTQLKTVSEGRIVRMEIPADWQELPGEDWEGAGYTREFRGADSPEVRICLHFRGQPVAPESSASFLRTLAMPAHQLSDKEQLSLDEILGNAAISEYCKLNSLRTDTLNGRMVLLMEGRWSGGNRSMQLYLSADEQGSIVQEVWCIAPDQEFANWRSVFEAALASIAWVDTDQAAPK